MEIIQIHGVRNDENSKWNELQLKFNGTQRKTDFIDNSKKITKETDKKYNKESRMEMRRLRRTGMRNQNLLNKLLAYSTIMALCY